MVCRIVAVERDESTAEVDESTDWGTPNEPEISPFVICINDYRPRPRPPLRLLPLRSIRLEGPPWPSAEAVAATEEEMQAEWREAFLKLCEGN